MLQIPDFKNIRLYIVSFITNINSIQEKYFKGLTKIFVAFIIEIM